LDWRDQFALEVFGDCFRSDDCQVDAPGAYFAEGRFAREAADLKTQRRLAEHEFSEVRHYKPTQNRLVRPEHNGFCRGSRCVHHVIKGAKESVSRQDNSTTVFIELQGLANAVKEVCSQRLFQFFQLTAKETLPIRVRASSGDNGPCLDHRTERLEPIYRNPD
jgi:hypothetical protein